MIATSPGTIFSRNLSMKVKMAVSLFFFGCAFLPVIVVMSSCYLAIVCFDVNVIEGCHVML